MQTKTYKVRAREGLEVPIDGKPRSYITAAAAVAVADNAYYRRQIACGDLIVVDDGKTQDTGGRDGKS